MSLLEPVKIGILLDYEGEEHEGAEAVYDHLLKAITLTAEEYHAAGRLDRPVKLVQRLVNGLPRGSFDAVRRAYHELVEEGCVVMFGPMVSENGAPLREEIEALARVPVVAMAATESMLGEWVFALPNGSLEEEGIILAQVAHDDGVRSVAIAYDDSLIGQEYLRAMRVACRDIGIAVADEVALPEVEADNSAAMQQIAVKRPDAIMFASFGLACAGINDALAAIGWMPPRYTTTAFNFGQNNPWWRKQLAGWIGLDQYDERNEVGQAFLDRFEARYGERPDYMMPLYGHDVGRLMLHAVATARPLTGRGVKEALERIKMMPAACAGPDTRLRFGKFIRHGWVGTEFLVARRYSDDGLENIMHGTINGHVGPYAGRRAARPGTTATGAGEGRAETGA